MHLRHLVLACSFLLAVLSGVTVGDSMISPDDCGVAYDCWLMQDGTKIAWRKTDGDSYVDIQMSRPDTGDYATPLYVAVGFSKDQSMGNDAVTECVFNGDQATAHLSWNTGKSNSRLPADIIASHVELLASRRSQGDLYCRVRQLINPAADIAGVIDLNLPYYLLAATGTAKATGINIHDFSSIMPSVYTQEVNVAGKSFSVPINVDPIAPPTINGLPPLPPIPSNPIGGVRGRVSTRQPPPKPPLLPPHHNGVQPEPEPEVEAEPETEPEHGGAHPEGEPEPNSVDDNRTKAQRAPPTAEQNDAAAMAINVVVIALTQLLLL